MLSDDRVPGERRYACRNELLIPGSGSRAIAPACRSRSIGGHGAHRVAVQIVAVPGQSATRSPIRSPAGGLPRCSGLT
jgi:hypothetical protein